MIFYKNLSFFKNVIFEKMNAMTYVETVLYNRYTDEHYVLIDVFLCDSLLVHDIDHLDVVIINLAIVEPMYLTSDLVVHILLVL